ncbi:MAG: L-threonylcarbamoyladenylate synthase [Thaumarchaeota archaeon]|nr:L-threonylcarbamoyladenylate synthase [Nitrososphaerota archaeon]
MLMINSGYNASNIQSVITIIKNGGIIIFPTDTIYGIGCDPYNQNAVEQIYKLKRRDRNKLFPILAYSYKYISKIANVNNIEKKLIQKLFPGPITILLKIKDNKLKKSLKLKDKIAVRIPNNKCALTLLKECKLLVGTSANISGINLTTNIIKCKKNFPNYDYFISDNTRMIGVESTIIEIINKDIIIRRKGVIKKKDIEKII